jgi:hypothetical protein
MVLCAFLLFRANVLLKCAHFDEPKPTTSDGIAERIEAERDAYQRFN